MESHAALKRADAWKPTLKNGRENINRKEISHLVEGDKSDWGPGSWMRAWRVSAVYIRSKSLLMGALMCSQLFPSPWETVEVIQFFPNSRMWGEIRADWLSVWWIFGPVKGWNWRTPLTMRLVWKPVFTLAYLWEKMDYSLSWNDINKRMCVSRRVRGW